MVTFFIIQRLLRKSSSAKSLRGGRYDRGNMALIGSATGIGLWLPIIFDALGIETFRINFLAGFVALAVMVCGVGLRIWAARTLGKFYTTTLMISEDQKIVSIGPYSKVRHPGYLAEILIWSGFGILSSNFILVFVLPAMFVGVLSYRISSEEKMLIEVMGEEYVEYKKHTRKLVPYLF